jgi:exopolysaccharide biosynthesis polyprenyl glycosylphosphotransferase
VVTNGFYLGVGVMQSRRLFTKHLAKVFDLCVLIAAFVWAGIVLSDGMTFARFMALRIKLSNGLLFALLLIAWHNLFILCGLYVSKRLTTTWVSVLEVCKATSLAAVLLIALARVFRTHLGTPTFVIVFWVFCTAGMVGGRLATRSLLLALRSRGKNRRFILIVGTNDRALDFAHLIAGRPELGYKIVGFVDDDWSGIQKFEATGLVRSCTFSGLADFLRHTVVDEAAMFLPLRSYYEHAAQFVSLCEQHGIAIRFDSQIFNFKNSYSQAQDWEGSQVVAISGSPEIWPTVVKRVLDCVFSGLLLVLLTPLFFVVAVLVKCTSPGSILFRQTRIGLNKRQFQIYKFRTMIANAEQIQDALLPMNEMAGPVFKITNDPRVTPLGRVLRKTSIDELPQLFNVLKGEMSLVGPRAMSLRDYQLFDQDWQRRRFSVKPGITCLWQVNGRSSIPFEQWMELDMQYIDKWSLWLDFKILARTVPAVLRGTGAA